MGSSSQVGRGGELDDTALHQEIELLGELIEKVADADHPLCQAEIDAALQVTNVPLLLPSERRTRRE
ncbi:hypothetical protein [Phycicoccus sp. Soil748]|uniref:hypothetical protein n=1 Tax=Phycicoccus sp. Soil748 TaxID=1736397 RepID=UPI000702BCDE|nr:hypothetical protein [Phycicoccus sp. Soil748]KRE56130.1 hypothetical protein ASG70_02910 [Phycicoccus sp. Soil748]